MLKKSLFIVVVILLSIGKSSAQIYSVYEAIPFSQIKAKASSEFSGFPVDNTINESGYQNRKHISNNLGNHMWISQISSKLISENEKAKKGVVWLKYSFEKARKIDCIEIWNHNQSDHTNRGLQKVYFQYSEDGVTWNTLKDGSNDYFIIPESKGKKLEEADFRLQLKGVSLKHFLITADKERGNYYHDGSIETKEDAQFRNQNIEYYGLSEIKFYTKTLQKAKDLPQIKDVKFIPSQSYLRSADGPKREYQISFDGLLYAGGKLTIQYDGKIITETIPDSDLGLSEFTASFPSEIMEDDKKLKIRFDSKQNSSMFEYLMPAARKWNLYLLPHSHLDIGYTHEHEGVLNVQWRNIEKAIDLINKTKSNPYGSQYFWNIESTWPLSEYFKQNTNSRYKEQLINLIKEGKIGVDASLGSILTGLCKQEELTHIFDDAQLLSKKTGKNFTSAMMSDIPGLTWGMVTALSQNGIKYFSMAPNYVPFYLTGGSRVGNLHKEWGDFPFYWQSESGKEKVLFWSAGKGYSFFHSWLADKLSACGLLPIWAYLEELEGKGYPYDMAYMRYTIYGDNGPPDEQMSEIIKAWNEKYEYPKFFISTTEKCFSEFEKKYGDKIPHIKGDMTPYWEDGAASTAQELAVNRRSSERLNQNEILWTMANKSAFPYESFYEGWRNTVLFSEHTWGASASGPDPHSAFTKKLWMQKQKFAINSDSISNAIRNSFVSTLSDSHGEYLKVLNTHLTNLTEVVCFSSSKDLSDKALKDSDGNIYPVQKIDNNTWLFVASDVPALSSRTYRLCSKQKRFESGSVYADNHVLSNGLISVEIDSVTGVISSLKDLSANWDYASGSGLNQYIYSGRDAKNMASISKVKDIRVTHSGSVFANLRITSDAPGVNELITDIRIYSGLKKIDIINSIDKQPVYDYENVRFRFPFHVVNSSLKVDIPFEVYSPERDQLKGSNKNFYSINNGIFVEGMYNGILFTSVDAPIVEIGNPTGENWLADTKEFLRWNNEAQLSPVIYSWVMNNSWRTNYKASQEGICKIQYTLEPVKSINFSLKQRSHEHAQPLFAFWDNSASELDPVFRLKGNHAIILSTMKPVKGSSDVLVRLTNTSDEVTKSQLIWSKSKPSKVFRCDNNGNEKEEVIGNDIWMSPSETQTYKFVY